MTCGNLVGNLRKSLGIFILGAILMKNAFYTVFSNFKSPQDLSRSHVFWQRSTFEWFLKFRETKNNLGRTFLVLICIFDMNIVSVFECLKIRCLRPQYKSQDRRLGFRRAARYSRGLVYTLFNRNLQFSVSECIILLSTEISQCVHYWVHPPTMFGNAIFKINVKISNDSHKIPKIPIDSRKVAGKFPPNLDFWEFPITGRDPA